jgi:hypothetical protein
MKTDAVDLERRFGQIGKSMSRGNYARNWRVATAFITLFHTISQKKRLMLLALLNKRQLWVSGGLGLADNSPERPNFENHPCSMVPKPIMY